MAIQAPGSAAAARALCDPPDSDWIVISGVSGTKVHRGAVAVEHMDAGHDHEVWDMDDVAPLELSQGSCDTARACKLKTRSEPSFASPG